MLPRPSQLPPKPILPRFVPSKRTMRLSINSLILQSDRLRLGPLLMWAGFHASAFSEIDPLRFSNSYPRLRINYRLPPLHPNQGNTKITINPAIPKNVPNGN